MDFTFISFYISLLAMIGMLLMKAREIRRGAPSFLSKIGNKTDHLVHGVYDAIVYWFSHLNKKTAIGITQWIAFHVLTWAKQFVEWVHVHAHRNPHSKKVIEMVQGKGIHGRTRKTAASVFLKRIAKNSEDVIE